MPIVVSEGRPKAPEGLHPAVCCDVVDLGLVMTKFGKKQHKVYIRWQLDLVDEDSGERYTATKRYTASLFEQSTLAKDLQSWRGRAFTPEEKQAFDLERLIGANCQLQIRHEGGWANVTAVVPPAKGAIKVAVADYVRVQDREQEDEPPAPDEAENYGNDDIPF